MESSVSPPEPEPVAPIPASGLVAWLRSSPVVARVAPYFIFVGILALQEVFGGTSKYWLYISRSLVGLWMIWAVRPVVKELRWTISLEAVLVGVGVIVVWVGADTFYGKVFDVKSHWNPYQEYGPGSALASFFIMARILFSSLVVPPIEEMFFRSFMYRYIIKEDFDAVSLKTFQWRAFLITSAVFGLVHREWLAGILCGASYQWLVLRRGHLGDAITAHAISNLLLGLWVAYKPAWQFW